MNKEDIVYATILSCEQAMRPRNWRATMKQTLASATLQVLNALAETKNPLCLKHQTGSPRSCSRPWSPSSRSWARVQINSITNHTSFMVHPWVQTISTVTVRLHLQSPQRTQCREESYVACWFLKMKGTQRRWDSNTSLSVARRLPWTWLALNCAFRHLENWGKLQSNSATQTKICCERWNAQQLNHTVHPCLSGHWRTSSLLLIQVFSATSKSLHSGSTSTTLALCMYSNCSSLNY